jgi:3-oxoacyl-[acyl-carrier-protein] synthase II
MELSILGIGTVSALGCGVAALAAGLRGEARPVETVIPTQTSRGLVNVPVLTASAEGLDRFVPKRALRRIDKFSRMAMLASFLAVEDAGDDLGDRTRVATVFGTGYGPLQTTFDFQDTIIQDGDRCASPTAFAGSVHNAPAAQVAIALQLEGPCQTLTCFDHTVAGALLTAEAWLSEGLADLALVGLGDEFHPVAAYARAEMQPDFSTPLAPLDFARCTVRPGEMFTALLLGRAGERPVQYGVIEKVLSFNAAPATPTSSIESISSLPGAAALILSASGRCSFAAYEGLALPTQRHAVYTPLYGGAPTAQGMDLAAAALMLREGTLWPEPEVPRHAPPRWNPPLTPEALPPGATLACAACAEDGACTFINVRRY